jgi:hypothetical protein
MDRRHFLVSGSAATGLGLAGSTVAVAAGKPSVRGPYIDLTTGKGNLIAAARLNGNLDESKPKYGSCSGIVCGVRAGEAVRDLFGFEVVSAGQAWKQPDGSFRILHRESILYTDLATGAVLSEYTNPYTNERVRVVDVVNDPWNEHFEEWQPRPPSYGGLNKNTDAPRKPYVLNWRETGGGIIAAQTHIHLYYPSALQPEKWPRESSGKLNQVSEVFTFMVRLEDMQNPKKTSLEYAGTWSRVTPWLPWLLMGPAPGHILYEGIVSTFDTQAGFKPAVLEYMQKTHPQMLVPPPKESWEKPNLSSLEVYARDQQPAPPLAVPAAAPTAK